MALGQVLLDRMELLHPELQVQPGEDGVEKALTAANMAQDYFESILALHPQSFGDQIGTVQTTPHVETTPFPLDLIRLDALWRLDSNGRQVRKIDLIQDAGGHAPSSQWPFDMSNPSFGMPWQAYVNGRAFFWSPLPDAVYTLRWYGLQAQPDIIAANPISYPDICLTPFATFAAKVIRIGLDDSAEQLSALSEELFTPVIAAMKGFRRDRPQTLTYSGVHVT